MTSRRNINNSFILSSCRKTQRININLSKHLLSAKNRNINYFNSFNPFAYSVRTINSDQTAKNNIPIINPYGIQSTIEEESSNRTDINAPGVKSNYVNHTLLSPYSLLSPHSVFTISFNFILF